MQGSVPRSKYFIQLPLNLVSCSLSSLLQMRHSLLSYSARAKHHVHFAQKPENTAFMAPHHREHLSHGSKWFQDCISISAKTVGL